MASASDIFMTDGDSAGYWLSLSSSESDSDFLSSPSPTTGSEASYIFLSSPHETDEVVSQLPAKDVIRQSPYRHDEMLAGGLYTHHLGITSTPDKYSETGDQEPRTFSITSRPMAPAQSPGEEEPWIPLDRAYRIPDFEPGFVAFLPEPQMPLQKTEEGTQPRSPAWEHTIVKKNGPGKLTNGERSARPTSRSQGKRSGKLAPETAKKAKRIREIRSCWRCWNLKVPCSEGEHCKACLKRYSLPSPTKDQLCCRTGFDEYELAFFPDFLNSHYKRTQIENLVTEHTSGFLDVVIDVHISTGESFRPMTVRANLFQPLGAKLLFHDYLRTENDDVETQMIRRYSAPIGLLGVDTAALKKTCLCHIEEMVANPLYAAQATAGDATQVPKKILETVQRYSNAKDLPLVRKVLMLHAINYFISHVVTFSKESASEVLETAGAYAYCSPSEPYLSSRLLNRQVKYGMHKLHRELTREVLEGLEKSMRTKSRDSWGPSLCVLLVLALCIENTQIAADTFVVCDLDNDDDAPSGYNRGHSFNACVALEEYPFQQCTRLFHDIYRSHKEGTRAKDSAFNPFKADCEVDVRAGWDRETNMMVLEMRELIYACEMELEYLSQRPAFITQDTQIPPDLIRLNNTGRLVSQFLLSFF
ncbi:fungal Zn binuclear cluster domain containing protein [Phlyctema vagabunda]|uniref:Fungal Zn binuclear cluster domain containing protein n=1 Tax=Phlyctema vagabunda TaxID=108571 RepID=A0ABR4PXZ4_9HELO